MVSTACMNVCPAIERRLERLEVALDITPEPAPAAPSAKPPPLPVAPVEAAAAGLPAMKDENATAMPVPVLEYSPRADARQDLAHLPVEQSRLEQTIGLKWAG
jgi:hypothetical protein